MTGDGDNRDDADSAGSAGSADSADNESRGGGRRPVTGSWEGFGWRDDTVPQAPLDDSTRSRLDLPSTLRPVADARAVQRSVFEPALKQYGNAYRAADPRFADRQVEQAWREARRTALDLVLAAVADSVWGDSLVLRGSVLLRAWFGGAAREPGDLDFVVTPASWRIEEARTSAMLDGIAEAAEAAARRAGTAVRIDAAGAVSDEIWTYDRVPGRRLVLPWTAEGLPGGTVQLDFVFNESLPAAPEATPLPAMTGDTRILLNAATAELSLAWKIMWLWTDTHPQGKDLYDAVLLAEYTPLRYELLRQVFLLAEPSDACRPVGLDEIASLAQTVEWNHFIAEYPDVTGNEADFAGRLSAALAPTFRTALSDAGEDGEYARTVWWLEPRIRAYREVLHRKSLRTAQKQMHADGLPAFAAVVITRELLGSGHHSLQDARDALFDAPAWRRVADVYGRCRRWLDDELARLEDTDAARSVPDAD
ncbi:nucleotidyl transferase AbiEii/AbiGii toxin family protein [Streptomyces sp. NBC_00820]|uniref:nucleotidyl transferase AbiEii/AbiGii toxin family protein n=1 Tax=Streptomyces sp. NBC_00820 TaxID=2975842 RepID=UPI002ED5F0B7|nr:nucleotidyl transferase AbiEii/AbiGii toxin family protein [Streptomyces sp. NBC_00820]